MQGIDKNAIIDNVWQYSHYYAQSLQTCEILYKEGQGIACLNVLFNVFENVSKSVIENYDMKFYNVLQTLFTQNIIDGKEFDFLNNENLSVRKIRNLLMHADVFSLGFEKECIFYPFYENDTLLMLYNDLSWEIFYIINKIVLYKLNH